MFQTTFFYDIHQKRTLKKVKQDDSKLLSMTIKKRIKFELQDSYTSYIRGDMNNKGENSCL